MHTRKATIHDVELITALRITFLQLFEDRRIDRKIIKQYFTEHIPIEKCTFLLTYDQDQIVGTGAIHYYQAIPSNRCPTGWIGHITNIWVNPDYRGKQIAKNILDQLIEDAQGKCDQIQLSSSADGNRLYERYGFKKKEDVYIWTMI